MRKYSIFHTHLKIAYSIAIISVLSTFVIKEIGALPLMYWNSISRVANGLEVILECLTH